MSPVRSRRLAPRRRRADEGEEESSTYGDIDDDSLSEGSAISGIDDDDGDGDASDVSAEEEARAKDDGEKQMCAENAGAGAATSATAESEAILNGLKISDATVEVEEVHFDDTEAPPKLDGSGDAKLADATTWLRTETAAQKSRREHQEYIKERNSNPAFVPNRGGFFLHDDRSNPASTSMRTAGRGRGRGGYGQAPPGRSTLNTESTDKQWTHDLHDKHENPTPAADARPQPATVSQTEPAPVSAAQKAPNRNFSFTTVIGNVSVNVSMPGMEKKTVPMVKRHHTLLPQHRPPLRRDKPVRISVPDAQPRYIFPSTERSFIFIPRALRPNQQSRVRGRGSFHGSRRTSIYGGSTYTPSVAMSRKSSIGGPVRDLRSPATAAGPRPVDVGYKGMRPVVRMPVGVPMPGPINPTRNSSGGSQYATAMAGSLSYGFHSTAIPMHQPRPQKTVSVGAIESPASFSVKGPPQPQYDQPFHQQMPQFVGTGSEEGVVMGGHLSGMGGAPAGVAMSHLPEGVMYAPNPYQPMPMMHEPMIYGGPYYIAGGMQFAAPMPGMPVYQTWAPAPLSQPPLLENVHQASGMGNEANGMVFYNGVAAPLPADGQPQQQFMMRGAAMNAVPSMMNPQAPYYYPPAPAGNFYPRHSG